MNWSPRDTPRGDDSNVWRWGDTYYMYYTKIKCICIVYALLLCSCACGAIGVNSKRTRAHANRPSPFWTNTTCEVQNRAKHPWAHLFRAPRTCDSNSRDDILFYYSMCRGWWHIELFCASLFWGTVADSMSFAIPLLLMMMACLYVSCILMIIDVTQYNL